MLKKNLSLILLILLIATAFIGCVASLPVEPLPDQSAISEGEANGEVESGEVDVGSVVPDQQEEEPRKVEDGAPSQEEAPAVTDPPAPKPDTGKTEGKLKTTFSINCSTVFDNLDKINAGIVETLPADGWIYPAKEVEFTEGESVFDILLRVTREESIHMESNSNPALKSKYVEGIHNLYEFDAGELSGWTYKINGKGMGYGSSSSYPKDGDIIEWVYTCDQGRDVGVMP